MKYIKIANLQNFIKKTSNCGDLYIVLTAIIKEVRYSMVNLHVVETLHLHGHRTSKSVQLTFDALLWYMKKVTLPAMCD